MSVAAYPRKAGRNLLTTAMPTHELVAVFAAEMATGVDRAVECWMAQIDAGVPGEIVGRFGPGMF